MDYFLRGKDRLLGNVLPAASCRFLNKVLDLFFCLWHKKKINGRNTPGPKPAKPDALCGFLRSGSDQRGHQGAGTQAGMGTGRGGDPQDTDRRMAEPLWGHNALLLIRFKMLVGHDGRGASFRGRAPVFAASDSNGRSGLWFAGGGELVAVSPKFVRLHRLLGVPPWPKGAGAGNGAVDPKFVSPVGGGQQCQKASDY